MIKSYTKNLNRMFLSNKLRFFAIGLIVMIGVAIATSLCALPDQVRDALANGTFEPDAVAFLHDMSNRIQSLGNIIPVFFIAVSSLAVLTTLTRLIEEDRPTVACYKTLGYSNFAIIIRYVFFAFACALFGTLIGLILGNFVLRPVMFNVVTRTFDVSFRGHTFYLKQGLIWSAAMIGATILTAILTALKKALEKPASLLRPRVPKSGSRFFLENITFIWKPLKFKYKSSLRNIWRYKLQFSLTVLAVTGAVVLMFTGVAMYASLLTFDNPLVPNVKQFTSSMSVVAITILACAVSLTILVLFNLTNINIEERKREIATLKVLGYTHKEVAGFIYREIAILSLIGILIGLPAGYGFFKYVMNHINLGFLNNTNWYVWLITATTAVISVIATSALLYRKIIKIEMLDSLKSVE